MDGSQSMNPESMVVSVRITLKHGRDDDLIEVIQAAPPRRLAATIREAMRSGIRRQAVDPDEDSFELPDMGFDL